MLITPANLRALNTTFVGDWQRAYEATPAWWSKIAMLQPSSSSQNDYGWMADIPKVREWVGERVVHDLSSYSYTIKNRPYELTLGIKADDIEDDNLGQYSSIASMNGNAFAKHPDQLMIELIAANPECFDGQNFFDTDHPVDPHDASKGVYSNLFTTQPLTQANFIESYGAMAGYVSSAGRPLEVIPNLLVISPALRAQATQIVVNATVAGGAPNDTQGWAEMLVLPELGTSTTWYLMDTSRPIKPFIYQERKKPTIVTKDQADSEDVLKHGEHRIYGTSRGAAGVSLPFLACRNVA